MAAPNKITNPDASDRTEVLIANGWMVLAKVDGIDGDSNNLHDLQALRKPMSDALYWMQYLRRENKKLLEFVEQQLESAMGCTEGSIEEGECKAYASVLEKITGRPA